jgi:hypothetical protein
MRRRLALLLLAPLLVSCGRASTPDAIPHPAGHRAVVIRLAEGAGMTTSEAAFSDPPVLVVTGDGTTYLGGEEVTAQGIVRAVFRYAADESGLQTLLHDADRDGLLAPPPDYTPPTPVPDAGDTTLELVAGGGHWSHRADALGDLRDDSAVRARLAGYAALLDRAAHASRQPDGPAMSPRVLRVLAQPVAAGTSPEGPVRRWPTGTGVPLARVGDCAVVRDPRIVHLLTSAAVRSYREAGTTYAVAAAVLLPGDSCPGGTGS